MKNYFFIKVPKMEITKVLYSEVLYIQANEDYCHVVTSTKNYKVHITLSSFDLQLPGNLFQRISRSYLVNIDQISIIDIDQVKVGEKWIILGKGVKKELLQKVNFISSTNDHSL